MPTLTLEEYINNVEGVFEAGLSIPEPAIHWKDKLEALEASGLTKKRSECLFDMRCEQVKMLGFQRVQTDDMVAVMMGEPHTSSVLRTDLPRQNHEWMYNHHTDEVCTNWGGPPHDWCRMEKLEGWYMPPFMKREKWRVRMGKLDHIKKPIPYGVVLRINELKSLKLFNAYVILAPIEAWERNTDKDPIVLGVISEIGNNEGETDKYTSILQVAHHFVARW